MKTENQFAVQTVNEKISNMAIPDGIKVNVMYRIIKMLCENDIAENQKLEALGEYEYCKSKEGEI